ncbi:ATP-binding protein [Paracoccus sp. CPCC 101403]|uniref:histidine kinase n=1 Tax=Paracoccus broussonetiae TaxID=3075834 RepID=A0ABU3E995_9RHOB|nr:ATP-binding protein [Paracoccus sp. CPCC 101403]MDT1060730.1 ATP-binding protein [Paracoccus sp. CPCC 101403]
MTGQNRPILESPLKLIAIGCLLLLATAGAVAILQRHALMVELEQESSVLLRLASQRADQHDAHLTALSAIAVAGEAEQNGLFLEVAQTISRFYPRIDEVQLVPFDARGKAVGTLPLAPALADTIRASAQASTGHIALLPHPDRPQHYIMVKRSPNTDAARYGLMLGIDAEKLVDEAGTFWSRPDVALTLSLPDGHALFHRGAAPETIRFARALGSASQPLLLETGMQIGIANLLPALRTGLALLAVTLAYLAALSALRQRARVRGAIEQARLSALDSRLAHASRVNALGEMASGLAHELTQPLTAILAQAQAGRRMLARGDSAALSPILDDTVAQARRASAMLERFRNWSRPHPVPRVPFDLREALRNVQTLLAPQAAAQGVPLAFDLGPGPAPVIADPVEMEQVVFNLARNAIEATAGLGNAGQVVVALKPQQDRVVLEVSDNGPGIAPQLRSRLFTPFTTTRPNGTGLGLALSQRLVERAGGEIQLVDGTSGATFRVVLPGRSAEARE